MASYNSSIPLATDAMLKSQVQIRANFQSINAVFSRNHVHLNNVPNQGKHNILSLRKQAADPTTGADQIALYTKLVGGIAQIFFRPENNQAVIQLTYPSILGVTPITTNPDVYAATQQTFVAGPFVVYGGLITGATNGQLVTLLPASTLIYVGLTIANASPLASGNLTAAATNMLANSFNIAFQQSQGPQSVYYLALGV